MLIDEWKLQIFCQWLANTRDCGWSRCRGYVYALRNRANTVLLGKYIKSRIDTSKNAMPALHEWLHGRLVEKPPGPGKLNYTDEDICRAFDKLFDPSTYDNCVWRSAIAIQFNTEGRSDRITRPDIGGPTLNSLEWSSGGHLPSKKHRETHLLYKFNKSKTNHVGREHISPPFCYCDNGKLALVCGFCETYRLCQWRKKWGDTKGSRPLFIFDDGTILNYNLYRNKVQDLK